MTTESSVGSDVLLGLAELKEEEQKLEDLIEEAEDELNEFINAQEAKVKRLKEVKRLIENLEAGGTGEIESLLIPLHCAPASATPASSISETEDEETLQTC
jgi:TolA-binding protein